MKPSISISSKKPDDNTKQLENLRKQGNNKECFDCGEKVIKYIIFKGTTYVVIKFGIFVCSKCAGIHRELNNAVKGIGVSNFSESDLTKLSQMGNDVYFIITLEC
jgi:hypothetical protein